MTGEQKSEVRSQESEWDKPDWVLLDTARAHYMSRVFVLSAEDPRAKSIPVPSAWARPVVEWIRDIDALANAAQTDREFLDAVERHADRLPLQLEHMDHDALAAVLEQGMATAVVEGAANSLAKTSRRASRLTLSVSVPSITFGPIAEAVAKLDIRSPVAVKLSSSQWSLVPVQLRERAQFSAQVESARFLQAVQDKVRGRLAWATDKIAKSDTAAGGNALFDRSSFIADMRAIAVEEGIDTTTPNNYGTVRDIRSSKRLGLIWDMQTNQATEFSRWKMDNDPDVLDAWPAQRLVRIEARDNPRPASYWRNRWADAFSAVGGRGALADHMVALKTSPIWPKVSIFGTPWPPFAWGSGMGLEDVDRDEAESLGLISPRQQVPPGEDPGFNSGFELGARDLSPRLTDWLLRKLGDSVQLIDGALKWLK
jgi:hypothetical protein